MKGFCFFRDRDRGEYAMSDVDWYADAGARWTIVPDETIRRLEVKVRILQERVQALERVFEERTMIDRAKELLARRLGLSEVEAMRRLDAESRMRNMTTAEFARMIVVSE
ncbi:MAG: hypothetical protein C3F08_00065 [Candidatus Methylomirabilota bacterium]|nr:MAG: hypothetical protein C3F08_00065 [candidate division NC10 bacterium]